jgi:hypothetical protein
MGVEKKTTAQSDYTGGQNSAAPKIQARILGRLKEIDNPSNY